MAGEIAASAFFGGIILFMIIWFAMFILGILGFVFWIFMIINVAKRQFKQENDKILWILVVILAGIIGALVYYFVIVRPEKLKKK